MKENRECFVLKPDCISLGIGKVRNKIIVLDPESGEKQTYLTVEWLSKPDDYREKLTVVIEKEVSFL